MPAAVPAEVMTFPFVDVEDVGIDLHGRVTAGEFSCVHPVRGRPAAIQHAGRGEYECTGADGDQARAALVRGAHSVHELLRRIIVHIGTRRDNDCVRVFQRVAVAGAREVETRPDPHRALAETYDGESVPGGDEIRPVDPEDLTGHRRLEDRHAAGQRQGDPVP